MRVRAALVTFLVVTLFAAACCTPWESLAYRNTCVIQAPSDDAECFILHQEKRWDWLPGPDSKAVFLSPIEFDVMRPRLRFVGDLVYENDQGEQRAGEKYWAFR